MTTAISIYLLGSIISVILVTIRVGKDYKPSGDPEDDYNPEYSVLYPMVFLGSWLVVLIFLASLYDNKDTESEDL